MNASPDPDRPTAPSPSPAIWTWALIALAVAPLVATAVVVITKAWAPVLDLAMTELRVRDVGTRHTPLIGLPGRIGTPDHQGSHAGPWYFYLIAPVYRLAGARASGMELATVVWNLVCLAVLSWLASRRFGRTGIIVAAAVAAVLIRGYSTVVLAQPWNPYFPVLFWAVGVAAAVLVLDGDVKLAPLVVFATSLAAQTHVPYLTPAVAVNGAVLAWLVYRRSVPGVRGALWSGLGTAALVWLPPMIDQLIRNPGNLGVMFRHFTGSHDEPVIGVGSSFSIVTQHLDFVASGWELVSSSTPFRDRAGETESLSIVGLLVLISWVVTAVWVVTSRRRALFAPFAVAGLLLAVDWFSISRIFGKVWFYLTLWMPITAILVWACLFAAAWSWWTDPSTVDSRNAVTRRLRPRQPGPVQSGPVQSGSRRLGTQMLALVIAASVIIVLAIPTWRDVIDYQVPEGTQGAPLLAVMPDVVDGLNAGVGDATGDDGTYILYWRESVFSGSLGLALLNELERRGYHVGIDDSWRVPATPHRVLQPDQATAQIWLLSGPWIDEFGDRPGFELLGEIDLRSEAARSRYRELQRRVIVRLDEIGRPDLVPDAQKSIFGLSLQDLPADITDDLQEMIDIGAPVAVYVAPSDTPSY